MGLCCKTKKYSHCPKHASVQSKFINNWFVHFKCLEASEWEKWFRHTGASSSWYTAADQITFCSSLCHQQPRASCSSQYENKHCSLLSRSRIILLSLQNCYNRFVNGLLYKCKRTCYKRACSVYFMCWAPVAIQLVKKHQNAAKWEPNKKVIDSKFLKKNVLSLAMSNQLLQSAVTFY